MTRTSTIFVVDADCSSRKSTEALINLFGMPTEVYASGEEFLAQFNAQKSGCLIADLRMPGMDGVELQETMKTRHIEIPTILWTACGDIRSTVRAMRAGAFTLLEKPCRGIELQKAIRDALAMDAVKRERRCKRDRVQQRFDELSPQEFETLELLVQGIANKNIARRLSVGLRTVEWRRRRILEKMCVGTVPELTQLVTWLRGEPFNSVFSSYPQ